MRGKLLKALDICQSFVMIYTNVLGAVWGWKNDCGDGSFRYARLCEISCNAE